MHIKTVLCYKIIKNRRKYISKKHYSKEFKFNVSLEMIRGDLTIAELISKYQIPRSVLSWWKKELLEKGATIFDSKKQPHDNVNLFEIEKLHSTIGRLKVENDFLHQASAKLKLQRGAT